MRDPSLRSCWVTRRDGPLGHALLVTSGGTCHTGSGSMNGVGDPNGLGEGPLA